MLSLKNKRIIISKTNQIGDVLFALPLASALKRKDPSCHIIFMGRPYTQELIDHYKDVDEFLDWDALSNMHPRHAVKALKACKADYFIHVFPWKSIARLAKKAKIPYRIGVYGRFYHWLTCNRLVKMSRKKSELHETQLDMKLLKPFGFKKTFSLEEIIELRQFTPFTKPCAALDLLAKDKFNLIYHPLTRGRKQEWPPAKFAALTKALPADKFRIFVTGVEAEGKEIRPFMIDPFKETEHDVVDLTGKLSLSELMHFISKADGMICCSTGPVHLAAAFGIHTLGLYAPIKPFHAERWGPVGKRATQITLHKNCEACRDQGKCACIANIDVAKVQQVVMSWLKA